MSSSPLVLITYRISDTQLDAIRQVSPRLRIKYAPTAEEAQRWHGETEILFGDIPSELFLRLPLLRWVQIATVGADRFLYEELLRSDVELCCSRGMHKYQMAELLFGLMVGISRRLYAYHDLQKKNEWTGALIRESDTLVGKTLGIAGLGSIGTHIASVGRAFGMHIVGTKRSPEPVPNVEKVFSPRELGDMLRISDHVVNVTPLTPETTKMFGENEFREMKPTAVFYNLGRGASVDTPALISALERGSIKAAALDTFEEEPLPSDSPLWKTKNLYLTPHVGGPIPHYTHHLVDIFIDNLRRYLDGRPLGTVVDKKKGY
ncbi:MAG TPA: D-2-hydroxyacid dehydrogenase [Bacteroidota bacterium]|nr:D-2-hydroxyacid dehydrogenase [Bacteroidota bacterium]